MTKAQLKQEKRNVEIVTSLLNRKLGGFYEKYLTKYVVWKREELITRKNYLEARTGKLIDPEKPLRGKYNDEQAIGLIETKLSRSATLAFEVMKEADASYRAKIDRVANKLVKEGINFLGLRLEMLKDVGMDFEFLISDDNMEVHARVIFANGEIKAPHFRFITTKRNK